MKELMVAGVVAPGDEIVWADGEYDAVSIDFTGVDGEPGKPITLRAETPGGVTFTGASTMHIGASYAVVSGFKFLAICDETAPWKVISFRSVAEKEASHTRLTNIVIEEAEAGPPVLKNSKWVVLFGQFNRVDHCHFTGKRSHDNLMTVYLDESPAQKPAWHRIDHNYFADRTRGALAGGSTNGWEIIRIGDSKTSLQQALCRVEYNYFKRCNGEIEIISNKSGNNVYLGNAFVECSGQLTLRHGFGCLVTGNVFIGSPDNNYEESGVRIIGPDHQVIGNTFAMLDGKDTRGAIVLSEGVRDGLINEYAPVTNALIRANRIVHCEVPFVVGSMHGRKAKGNKQVDVPPSDVRIEENIVIGKSPIFQMLSQDEPGIELVDNLAYTNVGEVSIPWNSEFNTGFTVEPMQSADGELADIHRHAEFIRQSSGPAWLKP